MTKKTTAKQYEFQTEVDQLLDLVINSLYGHSEIFLRELISNASDANDKLRFKGISDEKIYEGDQDLKIKITIDPEQKTLTVEDNGIGMTEKEIIDNIGTIANSGTKKFLEKLSKEKNKENNLIGQFGVGFYSAFIVAKEVTLITRKAGTKKGFKWVSTGKNGFTLEACEKAGKGTQVVLALKEDAQHLLNPHQVRAIVKKYSDHIHFPIEMQKVDVDQKEGESPALTDQYEQVNDTQALWTKPKKDITEKQYNEFYKNTFLDYQEPQACLHNHVEGSLEYKSLLFIPSNPPFDLWDPKKKHGIKLFVKRVFVMDHTDLLPNYLRFVRGLIDSNDMPLNVSREILQENQIIKKIRSATVSRILKYLENLLEKEPAQYTQFWNNFGTVLKEGAVEDFENKDTLSKLLRFRHTEAPGLIGLDDYIANMKESQNKIYYILSSSVENAKNSPHLELFASKGIDVLVMTDPIDEWVTSQMNEYQGKTMQSVTKEDADLEAIAKPEGKEKDTPQDEKQITEEQDILELFKNHLSAHVQDVRASKRLTESPSCLVTDKQSVGANMQKVLESLGQGAPDAKPILEINTNHPLVKDIPTFKEEDQKNWMDIIYGQAELTTKNSIENPRTFIQKINQLLQK